MLMGLLQGFRYRLSPSVLDSRLCSMTRVVRCAAGKTDCGGMSGQWVEGEVVVSCSGVGHPVKSCSLLNPRGHVINTT